MKRLSLLEPSKTAWWPVLAGQTLVVEAQSVGAFEDRVVACAGWSDFRWLRLSLSEPLKTEWWPVLWPVGLLVIEAQSVGAVEDRVVACAVASRTFDF